MREVWVISACLALINETTSHYKYGLLAPDVEKEFSRLQGDLYSLSQIKVFKPRALVDLTAAVSSALLMNEPQWVGIILRPINYSLEGAVLHIDTGPGLKIESSNVIEIESNNRLTQNSSPDDARNNESAATENFTQLTLIDGKIELPDWCSNTASILWLPVCAFDNRLTTGIPSAVTQKQSIVDGMRTIALKLEFGSSHNQTFERTVAVHFTDPFHLSTCVADKCNEDTLLLQICAVLYPGDATEDGKLLRLKQQFFLCSASFQIRQPILFLSGLQDEMVPPSHMQMLYDRAATDNKSNH